MPGPAWCCQGKQGPAHGPAGAGKGRVLCCWFAGGTGLGLVPPMMRPCLPLGALHDGLQASRGDGRAPLSPLALHTQACTPRLSRAYARAPSHARTSRPQTNNSGGLLPPGGTPAAGCGNGVSASHGGCCEPTADLVLPGASGVGAWGCMRGGGTSMWVHGGCCRGPGGWMHALCASCVRGGTMHRAMPVLP